MRYRLGIDLGTNSLGWAAIQLSDTGETRQLSDMGVRIFSDARHPKDKSSNAAQRRGPRSLRRNRDRRVQRKHILMNALVRCGLMPADKIARKQVESEDPWILRARALNEQLQPHEIGRAIFHLAQRRGFKSNRKTDGGDSESGKVYDAISRTRDAMQAEGAETLGQLFGQQRQAQHSENLSLPYGERKPLPQARVRSTGEGAKQAYTYYPQRKMILDEFDAIWKAQSQYNPELMNPDAHNSVLRLIEHQRKLRPQNAGKCTFLPEEERAPKALPSAQRMRVLQEVNNLLVGATGDTKRPLTDIERKTLVEFLIKPSSKTARREFRTIRRKLGLPDSQLFNLESEKRTFLVGDETAARLMQTNAWGADWLQLDLAMQDEIVRELLEEEDELALIDWLNKNHQIEEPKARDLSKLSLPDGHGKLSHLAISRLLPHLEAGKLYDEAASLEFGSHSLLGDGENHEDYLPYYGEVLNRHTAFEKPDPENVEERFGKIANPTVHVALNELRKVVNDLIRRYGPPTEIVLEVARDLPLSARGLAELEKEQKQFQDDNERRRAKLAELGVTDSYDNRQKLKLYEELPAFGKSCVFSGEQISETQLFTDEIEVEHILPVSKTQDDTFANKVLATRQANRDKGNRTPFEAFSNRSGYDWDAICQRAEDLPANKRWRFQPDALEKFERESDFLPRHLNDTRYISKLGRSYISALFGGQGAKGQTNSVWVVAGKLTSDMRHYAGLNGLLSDENRKERTDHRHHAIDAFVVAMTDRSMVKRAAELAQNDNEVQHFEIMKAMAEPLKRYRNSIADRLAKLTVSHKPDHGFQDAMHNDTAYGLTGDKDEKGNDLLVTRKPLTSFDKPSQLEDIRDARLRGQFLEATHGLSGKAFTDALVQAGEAMKPKVFSVRIITPMKSSSFVTITHGKGHAKAYKGDGNYCYDIWVDESGKWTGEVITTFEAYQFAQADPEWWRKNERPDGTPLMMRIRNGDMLEIDWNDKRTRVFVYQMSAGKINMAEHFESDASSRIKLKSLERIQKAPSSLQKANAVILKVTPSGKVSRQKP